jgi:predicted protein tyrosine phosphatase
MQTYIGLCRAAEQIYMGAAREAIDTALLRAVGITAIANLTPEDFGSSREVFKYLQLDQDDTVDIPPAKIKQFLDWMDARMCDGDHVLVHCHMGISRTPSLIIAWLMHHQGACKDDDLKAMWNKFEDQLGKARPIIQPHWRLKRSVLEYFGYEYAWPKESTPLNW